MHPRRRCSHRVEHAYYRVLASREAARARRALPSLRHGHATALLLAGVHPKVARERFGHHSVAFTLDRYSHTIDRLHDDAAAKVDAIFKPSVANSVARG